MSAQTKTFQELIEGETPVLVDFFATWCGPCKMMQPVLEDASRQLGDKVKIVKVDIDRNPLAASKFQVRGVPTLILFHKGKILWRAVRRSSCTSTGSDSEFKSSGKCLNLL